jgi:outer membrane protein assembly factor BamD (BamD/ComL family)
MQFSPRRICGPKQPAGSWTPSLESIVSSLEIQEYSMKKFFLLLILALLMAAPASVRAQGGAKQTPQAAVDSDLEKDSAHNLEVARQYFKLRKAYVAALQRCEEIIAGNPTFSKIDEVLFMAGESSLNLAEGKGKQLPSLYVIREGDTKRTLKPDEFRDLARDYFSQLIKTHPESTFRSQAEAKLGTLGGPRASK